jgi:hypothetical protein
MTVIENEMWVASVLGLERLDFTSMHPGAKMVYSALILKDERP